MSTSAPPTGGADVLLSIDTRANVRPISPFIYGTNSPERFAERPGQLKLGRVSGNSYSTYNWELNAANPGFHWYDSNIDLDDGDRPDSRPAAVVLHGVEDAHAGGAAVIVTVPLLGWVAGDTNGVVNVGESIPSRFRRSVSHKPGPFSLTPDPYDDTVYQDEFVSFIDHTFRYARSSSTRTIWYCLDNEPSLWAENHPRAHPDLPTYAEVISKSLEYAAMVKSLVPEALVLGPVEYGWDGFVMLQGAPDMNAPQYVDRNFLENFLLAMHQEQLRRGRPLIDALDIHWYPEARGGGVRITGPDDFAEIAEARVQAPRSLWDPGYVEESWITAKIKRPIDLLPWLYEMIDTYAPGTKLVISEYNYGGGGSISGAIAEADVLGIFGRDGVYGAAIWELDSDYSFTYAAIEMYRNFDGQGARFGDIAVQARTSVPAEVSVYAARDSQDAGRLTLVIVNKAHAPRVAAIDIATDQALCAARMVRLTAAKAAPVPAGEHLLERANTLRLTLPADSVTTVELGP